MHCQVARLELTNQRLSISCRQFFSGFSERLLSLFNGTMDSGNCRVHPSAYMSISIMHIEITLANMIESRLFLTFIRCIKLFNAGKRSVEQVKENNNKKT